MVRKKKEIGEIIIIIIKEIPKNKMKKSVKFNEDKNAVYLLVVWNYAYREARKSNFQQQYLDRLRFERRIRQSEDLICKILDKHHRNVIYRERFMCL